MTEKITTVYYKGNPIALYILGLPQEEIHQAQAEQGLFAVNLPEVLEAMGLLEPLDTENFYELHEIKEIATKRALTISRYVIPHKLISPERYSPLDSFIPVNFRHIACLDGVFPESMRYEIFNVGFQIEEIIGNYTKSINDWIKGNRISLTRVDDEGNQQKFYHLITASLAEIVKVCHIGCMESQINGGDEPLLRTRVYEDSDFVAEDDIAKYLKVSRNKLKQLLVTIGMLEKQSKRYQITNMGTGYSPKYGRARKWHTSIIKLLENAELFK